MKSLDETARSEERSRLSATNPEDVSNTNGLQPGHVRSVSGEKKSHIDKLLNQNDLDADTSKIPTIYSYSSSSSSLFSLEEEKEKEEEKTIVGFFADAHWKHLDALKRNSVITASIQAAIDPLTAAHEGFEYTWRTSRPKC